MTSSKKKENHPHFPVLIIPKNYNLITRLQEHNMALICSFGSQNDVSGYLAEGKDYCVLAFKGTVFSEIRTVLYGLMFWHKAVKGVRYHAGFYKAYEKLLPCFNPAIKANTKPLYITGHSLGGAIAIITALNMPINSFEACYTFGSPRVCNHKGLPLAENKAIFRVINGNDIVPSLPPRFLGYVHIGTMYRQ